MTSIIEKIRCKTVMVKRHWVYTIKTHFFIKKLLNEKNKSIKLELGATEKRTGMEDWITVDINILSDIYLDLSKPFPLPDNSVDAIYSSHLLEHLSHPYPLIDLLKECLRILKPGGSFSACVPNAKIYAELYLNKRHADERYDVDKWFTQRQIIFNSNIDYLNHMAYMRGEHKYMFDEENLPIIVNKAGFSNIRLRKFDPALDMKERDYESIYVEGVK